jgi:protein ImuB
MSLWLCLRFRQLPLQCLNRSETQAVIIVQRQRVLRCNDHAAAAGVREGMATSTARALLDDQPMRLLERDPGAEQRGLKQLCCWAYSITPHLHCWREDCLLLEIGGCLNLFKGLQAILQEVGNGLGSRGFHAHPGLAATPKAAWLMSFAEEDKAVAIDQPLQQRLAPLPLNLLQDFPSTVDSLRRAGLETLGDILALPPAAMARRCGKSFVDFLQQAMGQRDDLQVDYKPPAEFSDAYWYGYEVKANGELLPAAQILLQSLCHFLRNTQLQSGEIHWLLTGVDRQVREIVVRSSSCHSDWQNWFSLTRLQFEQLQLETGVEGLSLGCREMRPGQLDSIDLFAPGNQREPLDNLLDRLRSRLGLQAIEKVGCRDEHLPELALHTGHDKPLKAKAEGPPEKQRPFWLMPQPQPLKQRGDKLYCNGSDVRGALTLIYGPERIEDNWWRQPASRDYYIARTPSGQHYWIFRDRLAQHWFIHGVFA